MFGAGGTKSYAEVHQDGSTNQVVPGVSVADLTDTVAPLDTFRKHGGKLISFVGTNDQLIYPRGVIKYYREMAARYGKNPNDPDFETLQELLPAVSSPRRWTLRRRRRTATAESVQRSRKLGRERRSAG